MIKVVCSGFCIALFTP
ncbi:hypothetical protein L1D18_22510 [Vibrio parahaemolyticus]|nr:MULTISPECIES: hypothetical protein [Vibrio]MCG9646848.1 hypothetical protein [Vibrio parahaemolyticus]MCS0191031.1 hypothetical protein [Vibrio parahaemolyticus]MCZ0743281.1 hypothetical protein [Vibrio diabolicus]